MSEETNVEKNNFFNWAMKETAQDTFIAWAINNIKISDKESEEYKFAKNLLDNILNEALNKIIEYDSNSVTVETQKKTCKNNRLDVLVTISNEKLNEEICIIFEDKLFEKNSEKENGLQIIDYLIQLEKENKEKNDNKKYEYIGVYYKMLMTNNEKKEIEERKNGKNILIYDRKKLKELMNKKIHENTILNSYKSWIENLLYYKWGNIKDTSFLNEENKNKKFENKALLKSYIYALFDQIEKEIVDTWNNKGIKLSTEKYICNDYLCVSIPYKEDEYILFEIIVDESNIKKLELEILIEYEAINKRIFKKEDRQEFVNKISKELEIFNNTKPYTIKKSRGIKPNDKEVFLLQIAEKNISEIKMQDILDETKRIVKTIIKK